MKFQFGLLPLVAVAAFNNGCQRSQAAQEARGSARPPGEVWLTPAEVAEAKIEVVTVGEQDVEDTILTGGTVTLDDLRTGHVFSPVTGKVVKITAELGARVKKGETLAIIESPDIGSAVSDVHKARGGPHRRRARSQAQEGPVRREAAASGADVEAAEDAERNAKAELSARGRSSFSCTWATWTRSRRPTRCRRRSTARS